MFFSCVRFWRHSVRPVGPKCPVMSSQPKETNAWSKKTRHHDRVFLQIPRPSNRSLSVLALRCLQNSKHTLAAIAWESSKHSHLEPPSSHPLCWRLVTCAHSRGTARRTPTPRSYFPLGGRPDVKSRPVHGEGMQLESHRRP